MSSRWRDWSGLIGAPLFWAVATQLGQVLPWIDCQSRMSWSLAATAVAILAALSSATISWVGASQVGPQTHRFISNVSVFVALAIAFALFLQGAATLMIDACDR